MVQLTQTSSISTWVWRLKGHSRTFFSLNFGAMTVPPHLINGIKSFWSNRSWQVLMHAVVIASAISIHGSRPIPIPVHISLSANNQFTISIPDLLSQFHLHALAQEPPQGTVHLN